MDRAPRLLVRVYDKDLTSSDTLLGECEVCSTQRTHTAHRTERGLVHSSSSSVVQTTMMVARDNARSTRMRMMLMFACLVACAAAKKRGSAAAACTGSCVRERRRSGVRAQVEGVH